MTLLARKTLLFCSFIVGTSLLFSCANFATDERKSVQLILKKDNKMYLFSSLGTMITKNSLDKNESPPILNATRIVKKNNELYVEPQHLENMVDLISGNYVLHDFQEKSFDGYVTRGRYKVYDKKYSSESTEKIGQMASTANIYLNNMDQSKTYHISWQRSPNQIAIENCTEMALWVDKSYKPGERVVSQDKFIMIKLNDIVEFYHSNVTLEYDDDGILYFISE
ncbi:MAG: hypothetical protein AAF489_11175 [Bacteroidota bacterium]